jgi:hypothetical protein
LRFEQIRIIHLSVPTITAAAAVPHFARIPTDDSRNKFHICAPVGNRNKKTRWKKAIRRDRILPKKSVFFVADPGTATGSSSHGFQVGKFSDRSTFWRSGDVRLVAMKVYGIFSLLYGMTLES